MCPTFNASLGYPCVIVPSVISNIYLHVPVFSVYPHNCMEFVFDQGALHVIILLNVVLGINNVAIYSNNRI